MKIPVACKVLFLSSVLYPLSHAAAIFTFQDDFSTHPAGGTPLVGHGGWAAISSTGAGQTDVGPNVTYYMSVSTNVAWGTEGGTYAKRTVDLPVPLNSSHKVILSFVGSVAAGSSGVNNVALGFGRDPDSEGASVPNHIAHFVGLSVRTFNYGAQHFAKTDANVNISLMDGKWYEYRSVFDLGAGTATLEYRELQGNPLAPVSGFTTAYFDAAQTQSTVPLGDLENIAAWDTLWIRMGTGGTSRIAYLGMEVIEEPQESISITQDDASLTVSYLGTLEESVDLELWEVVEPQPDSPFSVELAPGERIFYRVGGP